MSKEKNEFDEQTYIFVQELVNSGRVTHSKGEFYFDGVRIEPYVPEPVNPGEVTPEGFFGAHDEYGARENVYINEILNQWRSSDDAVKNHIAKTAARKVLFLDANYFPPPGNPIRKIAWWNRTKYWNIARNGHWLQPLYNAFDYSLADGRLVFVAGNYTYPDHQPEKRSQYTDEIPEAYRKYLDGLYKKATTRPLGLGGRTN
jgi:hypothetical protein